MVESKAPALYHMRWIKTNNGEQVHKAVLPTRESGPWGTDQGRHTRLALTQGSLLVDLALSWIQEEGVSPTLPPG